MKYSIRFYRGCRILDKVDEIIVKYKKADPELIDFIKEHPQQKIVADITDLPEIESSFQIFLDAAAVSPRFTVLLIGSLPHRQNYEWFHENNIPFFFCEYADNFDTFQSFVINGASEIRIAGELGFHIRDIAQYCNSKGIKVRVYPNVAQEAGPFSHDAIETFFIRPEAVSLYEPYVDIFEFWGDDNSKQDVLYQIYEDRHWNGTLNELILSYHGAPVDNLSLLPQFDVVRLGCNKICTLGKCNSCTYAEVIAKAIEKHGIQIKEKREPIKKNEDNNK